MDGSWQLDNLSIAPGQIWAVTHAASAPTLSQWTCDVLGGAHVIIYDRMLEKLLAKALPLGSYAEAWSLDDRLAIPVLAPRALKLALDGWSVVQLTATERACRIQPREAEVADNASAFQLRMLGWPHPSTVIFGLRSVDYQPQVSVAAFTANGLAG